MVDDEAHKLEKNHGNHIPIAPFSGDAATRGCRAVLNGKIAQAISEMRCDFVNDARLRATDR